MKKFILAAAVTFAFAPAAFAGSNYAGSSYNTSPQSHAGQGYVTQGYAHQGYANQGYAQPTYANQGHGNPSYGNPSYAHQNYAPAHAGYEDEVIAYEERARRKQSYYFNPRDARSFKCRGKHNSQKCTFEFRGDNANDVEYYLAQALIHASGNNQHQAQCFQKRRGESVTCGIQGDLRYMDTGKLRRALYGR